MQRQLCIKLFSKISQNCTPSSLLKPTNPFHQQFLFHHSTLSRSQFYHNGNGVLGKIGKGFYSSPCITGPKFFSSALVKAQSKCATFSKVWVRRDFHSFDSHSSGWRSVFRRITPDGVVIGIVIANVAVFMLWRAADTQFMVENFMISVENVTSGRIHTMITSAFSHRDPWHLVSNMIGFYFFGSNIGRMFGAEYLLKLYLTGAVAGSILYLAYNTFFQEHAYGLDAKKIAALGASGAVNAVVLLDIFLFPTRTILVDFIIPVPAMLFGAYMIGRDLMRIREGDRSISGAAHIGGATVAAIAWVLIKRGRYKLF